MPQIKRPRDSCDGLSETSDYAYKTSAQTEPLSRHLSGTDPILRRRFDDLNISESLKKGLRGMGLVEMTEIQWKCLPILLQWRDAMVAAKTGSGKTIAFLIPVVELILQLGMRPRNGTGAIIISPTRELCLQIYDVLKKLAAFTQIRIGLIMGGTSRHDEAQNFKKGITILVATPGRLLYHLTNTEDFFRHNLKALVVDEADRLLDIGFNSHLEQILHKLPENRQTILSSATLSEKAHKQAMLTFKTGFFLIGVEKGIEATVETLEQSYVICDPAAKFSLLYDFLSRTKNKKVMVFMSACLEVQFYCFFLNYINVAVKAIHGRQKQAKRISTFRGFVKAQSAVLLCTNVGARGLDIPEVDWIVQFDPPDDPKDYIHRVGRTARAGKLGRALLMLRPHELGFLEVLRNFNVTPVECEVLAGNGVDKQQLLERHLPRDRFLTRCAHEAFEGVVRSYKSSKLGCFNINELDLGALSKNFGLQTVPEVDFGGGPSKRYGTRRTKRRVAIGTAVSKSAKRIKFN